MTIHRLNFLFSLKCRPLESAAFRPISAATAYNFLTQGIFIGLFIVWLYSQLSSFITRLLRQLATVYTVYLTLS